MSASVRANGLDIHYVREGHGPPLLLLHGATSMGTHDWGAQRPLLRSDFTLYMPDARGHHRTVFDVREGWSRSALVDDAVAFADALGLPRFHLMGLSMGARTAVELAARWPERVLSMLVIAPSLRPQPAASVARRRMDPEAILRDDPAWAAELERRHDPHQGAGSWYRLLEAIREDTQHLTEVMPEELRRIRLPVTLACGDDDPWMPLDEAVRIKRQLPEGRLLVVPDCGHVVEAERPSVFNPAMTAFFRRALARV
jgi:3-oxoadipate enol-lactonase / 4-carboxymuconolactone decarboxylase